MRKDFVFQNNLVGTLSSKLSVATRRSQSQPQNELGNKETRLTWGTFEQTLLQFSVDFRIGL